MLALLLARAGAFGFYGVSSAPRNLVRTAVAAYFDAAYVAGLVAAGLLLLAGARRSDRASSAVVAAFRVVAVFSLALALVNAAIVHELGHPMNYQWLSYSDFLRSRDAADAVLAGLSIRRVLLFGLVLAIFFVVERLSRRAIERTRRRFGGWRMLAATGVLAAGYFGAVGPFVRHWSVPYGSLANPIVFFAESVWASIRGPRVWRMETHAGTEDFASGRAPALSGFGQGSGVRNVVVFVFESVAAQYLDAYGGGYAVSPELEGRRSRSAVFTRIYTPCSYTPSALAAMVLSIYPCVFHGSITRSNPDLRFPSLAAELQRRGYATAYFGSADVGYQRIGEFLSAHGFDRVEDYRTMGCGRRVLEASSALWPFLDATDDACLASAFARWRGSLPAEKPFFAMLWTSMTHYPYFPPEKETDLHVEDPELRRYLGALREGDRALGLVLRRLEESGAAESTLVAVLGDHGEAFGQHGQRVHGTDVYEENVHIPMVMINPRLFGGERNPVLGSTVDLAPTVLDTLGFDYPREWQGRSLWSADPARRVFFANIYSAYTLGYRDDDRKVIYDSTRDRSEIYELDRDPQERRNRASEMAPVAEDGKRRLAGWIQYQRRLLRDLAR